MVTCMYATLQRHLIWKRILCTCNPISQHDIGRSADRCVCGLVGSSYHRDSLIYTVQYAYNAFTIFDERSPLM